MKKLISCLFNLIFLFTISVNAQTDLPYELTICEDIIDEKGICSPDFLEKDDGGYYFFQKPFGNKIKSFHLLKLDSNFKLEIKTTHAFGEEEMLKEIYSTNNGNFIALFYTLKKEKKKKTVSMFYRLISKKTLLFSGEKKLLFEADESALNSFSSPFFLTSPDKSKLLLVYQVEVYGENKREPIPELYVKVFSSEMLPLWSTKLVTNENQGIKCPDDFVITNEGHVFTLGYKIRKEVTVERSKMVFPNSINLCKVNSNDTPPDIYGISFSRSGVRDFALVIGPDENLILTASYFEKNDKGNSILRGIAYQKISIQTLDVLYSNIGIIPESLIKDTFSHDIAGKSTEKANEIIDWTLFRTDLYSLVVRDNGGLIWVGEERQSVGNASDNNAFVDFYCQDLFVIQVGPKGSIDQFNRIRKDQLGIGFAGLNSTIQSRLRIASGSTPPDRISYGLMAAKDKVCLLFNDDPRNMTLEPDKKPVVYKAMNITSSSADDICMSIIDKQGNQKRYHLIDSKEYKKVSKTSTLAQVSENEAILLLFSPDPGKNEEVKYSLVRLRIK